ncbi:MAG: tetratricopeptide repeat protein, partial [Candidatus Zixiibacteriota bacterium]
PMLELLAGLYAKLGEFEAAIDCFEQCLRLEPRSASALVGLSECYLAMGHRDSAIMGFRRALQLDPHCQQAENRLAELQDVATPPAG